jgi:hypothetical protein
MFNYIKFKSKIIILKLLKKLDSYSTANRKLNKEIKEYEVKRAEMNKSSTLGTMITLELSKQHGLLMI